ncbi:hypothetical protein HUJ05_007632 [Dendroctonus ponderosae]|nr:hypothetical protein HUJ05_007632 [Dendroctonus ponderosae]
MEEDTFVRHVSQEIHINVKNEFQNSLKTTHLPHLFTVRQPPRAPGLAPVDFSGFMNFDLKVAGPKEDPVLERKLFQLELTNIFKQSQLETPFYPVQELICETKLEEFCIFGL